MGMTVLVNLDDDVYRVLMSKKKELENALSYDSVKVNMKLTDVLAHFLKMYDILEADYRDMVNRVEAEELDKLDCSDELQS